MATHSSILAWRIPWTEAPSGLQSRASHMTEHACTNTPFSNLNFRVFIPWVSVKILMVKNPGLLVRELLHTLMPTLWPLFELLSWRLLSICNTTLGCVLLALYLVSSPEVESLEPLCLNRESQGDGWRWWSEWGFGVKLGLRLGDRGRLARCLVSASPLLLKTVFTFLFMATLTARGILVPWPGIEPMSSVLTSQNEVFRYSE